ncbi:MAG: MmcQ/YjbR family DNA-binding protein [Dehalococcoidia bacterium]|nr:MmcQ/YjbR family DNA-binding protein [Dehalococcoidia bacterium]
MATQDDVRRIASSLPGVVEEESRFGFNVVSGKKPKQFAWVWLERTHPKKARVPQPKVLAVRVTGEEEKDFLVHAQPEVFFTEAHYNGYPAVLIRLEAITLDHLETMIVNAWHLQASKALIAEYAARAGAGG